MRSAKEYRAIAKENVSSYKGVLAIITLITLIISAVLGFTVSEEIVYEGTTFILQKQPIAFLNIFIAGQFAIGWVIVSKAVYKKEECKVGTFFGGFKNYGKVLLAHVLQSVYLALWGLISFGIVSIVKTCSYSLTYYIMNDNPSLTVNEAITESRRLMNGRKWKLFCLSLSYIGWILLCVLTLGILFLWVEPRMYQATYVFYQDCLKEDRA